MLAARGSIVLRFGSDRKKKLARSACAWQSSATLLAMAVLPAPAGPYGNRDCQASKGLDKHVSDGDAGFVDM